MIEVDPAEPAFGSPTQLIGLACTARPASEFAANRLWVFKRGGEGMRHAVSPESKRNVGIRPVKRRPGGFASMETATGPTEGS